jgi:hypothetical protein
MADPVSLSAATIAVLTATKAFEKTGEKLSEATWNLVSKFLSSLKKKDLATAIAIEEVAQKPGLIDEQPGEFGIAVLVEKVEKASKEDINLRQSIEAISDAIRTNPKAIVNMTQLAEKIGVVIQGGEADFRGATFNL